jgi:hypothetical protein
LNHLRRTPSTLPQTLEEEGRDSTRTEISELDRIRVTNKYAMDMASKRIYGDLCFTDEKARINM